MTATESEAAGIFRNLLLEPIYRGVRVKLSEDGRHYVDVLEMFLSWRIVTTPLSSPMTWDRGWCYFGFVAPYEPEDTPPRTKGGAFTAALLAAAVWDGNDGTEPAGYNKRVGDL